MEKDVISFFGIIGCFRNMQWKCISNNRIKKPITFILSFHLFKGLIVKIKFTNDIKPIMECQLLRNLFHIICFCDRNNYPKEIQ